MTKFINISRHTANVIAVVFNVFLAVLTMFSAYGGLIDPETTTIGALAAMGFHVLLLLLFVVLIVNVFLYKRLAVLNVVTLLLCAPSVFTYCPFNLNQGEIDDENSDRAFRLITYNCYVFRTYGHESEYDPDSVNVTFSYIINSGADMVCLQESEYLERLERWHHNRPQIDSLFTAYPFSYTNPSGLTLLSKYPFDRVKLNKTGVPSDFACDFTCARVRVKGHELYLFNMHLQSFLLDSKDKKLFRKFTHARFEREDIDSARFQILGKLNSAYKLRAKHARLLRNNIDSLCADGKNVIVCGDFNDLPGSYATRVIKGDDLTDAYGTVGFGPGITYHVSGMYFRIDHIFYSGDMKCIAIDRAKVPTSDHYPLEATFVWDN